MKKLYLVVKKYGVSTISLFIGIDSYRRLIRSERMEQNKDIIAQQSTSGATNDYATEKERFEIIKEQNKELFDSLGVTSSDEFNYNAKLVFDLITKGQDNQSVAPLERAFLKFLEADNKIKQRLEAYRSHYKLTLEKQNLDKEYEENLSINKSDPELKVKIEDNNKKLNESKDKLIELEEISKSNIGEIFNLSYEKYVEFLDGLTADKIVCVVNIIIGGITLSSFLSVLSIMISENIINRIKFLDKYPRILKLLKLRNSINKKFTKLYLFLHFIWILLGILCNIYMLYL